MLPETLYRLIAPHLEGYSDKNKEELIKMIQGEDHPIKPEPMTEREKRIEDIKQSLFNRKKRKF
jgi:hypothetical protein